MIHTPLDFLITTALLGSLLPFPLQIVSHWVEAVAYAHSLFLPGNAVSPHIDLLLAASALWFLNQGVRRIRLGFSRIFEHRASAELLSTEAMQAVFFSSFALIAITMVFALAGMNITACLTGLIGVVLTRYLFFVSVVPLNMALTFVRGGSH